MFDFNILHFWIPCLFGEIANYLLPEWQKCRRMFSLENQKNSPTLFYFPESDLHLNLGQRICVPGNTHACHQLLKVPPFT